MRTFLARLRVRGRSLIGGQASGHEAGGRARRRGRLHPARVQFASARGDTLIEVIVSALLLGVIVVGTFTGLNSTNRSTSIARARSQADALAEQSEEQMRTYSIQKLGELEGKPVVESPVIVGSNKYTIEKSAAYFPESSSGSSCTSSAEAGYIQTNSKVTSPLIGKKPVEETSSVSPPADATLNVSVTESSSPVTGASVTATGPAPTTTPHTLETSTQGCAIIAVSPGEYTINVKKVGYVTANGLPETIKDPSPAVTHSVYIAAENTAKEGYYLGQAGTMEVKFTEEELAAQGDSFVAFNTGQEKPRSFGIPGTYGEKVTSTATLFPFKSSYTVYAGTCEADLPSANGVPLVPAEYEKAIVTGGNTTSPTVRLGPVRVLVWSGFNSSKQGKLISGAEGYTEDTGCNTKRNFTTTSALPVIGTMPHPGLPFGKYRMCVGSGTERWEGEFSNNSVKGPTTQPNNGGVEKFPITEYGMIYLGIEGTGKEPTGLHAGGKC